MGPNYTPPEIAIKEAWVVGRGSEEEIVSDWWNLFDEPLLTQIIEKGVIFNKDILAAEANILQAIALKQVAASNLFPQIGADLSATKTYFSKNGPLFAIGPAAGSATGAVSTTTGLPFAIQTPQIQNLFNALFDVSWQIDLFGKTRRGVEAAVASIESAIDEKNGMLLVVMSEIARTYMQLRSNQTLALLTEENLALLEKKGEILLKSLKAGYINQLDYEAIGDEIASAKALLPPLIAECYQSIYALSTLTGEPPETLLPTLLPPRKMPSLPKTIALGIRSEVLKRRPDVRSAERKLAAATANIGVAVASFFPAITLYGDGGLQSLQFNNLFNWQSRTWDYGGDVMMPIYQGGLLFGQLHASQAARTFAAANYEQVVLSALQEAERYIMSYHQDLKKLESLEISLQKRKRLVFLTEARVEVGLTDQMQLIDMQREFIAAEETYTSGVTQSLYDLISLYKSLGGGWNAEEEACENGEKS